MFAVWVSLFKCRVRIFACEHTRSQSPVQQGCGERNLCRCATRPLWLKLKVDECPLRMRRKASYQSRLRTPSSGCSSLRSLLFSAAGGMGCGFRKRTAGSCVLLCVQQPVDFKI